jgi:hypothetical protein
MDIINIQTILDIMKSGALITFDDGFYLKGLPGDNYIEVGLNEHSEGLWILNDQGLTQALNDLSKMRKENQHELSEE